MNGTKTVTVRFSPDLYERLEGLATQREMSVGELVCLACEELYGLQDGLRGVEGRVEAVRQLGELSLPVGTPQEIERESIPNPEDLEGFSP